MVCTHRNQKMFFQVPNKNQIFSLITTELLCVLMDNYVNNVG